MSVNAPHFLTIDLLTRFVFIMFMDQFRLKMNSNLVEKYYQKT